MVAVVGTSPRFLSLATEVLTEVPYALGILAVLYWIGRWDESAGGTRRAAYAGVLVALAFTPVVRTIGVALVAAVGLWSLTSRRRLKLLPADEKSRRFRHPRSFANLAIRSIGDVAMTAKATRWRMSGISPSKALSSEVHIGHGCSRLGPSM